MARIRNRDFSTSDLRSIFRVFDRGGTYADVQEELKQLQGRGASNPLIRELRDVHRGVRRTQGYNIKRYGPKLRILKGDRLIELRELPSSQKIHYSRRPAPPRITGYTYDSITAVFHPRQDGRLLARTRVTRIGSLEGGAAALREALEEAATVAAYHSEVAVNLARSRQRGILRFRPGI